MPRQTTRERMNYAIAQAVSNGDFDFRGPDGCLYNPCYTCSGSGMVPTDQSATMCTKCNGWGCKLAAKQVSSVKPTVKFNVA